MFITLTGPSGVGKGHLTSSIQSALNAKIVPWTTTRKPREDEDRLGNRHFVSKEDFNQLRLTGLLVGVQELYGEFYGLEKQFLGLVEQDALHICEINSANVLEMFPFIRHRFSIALITEDYELLRERIVRREPTIGNNTLSDRLEVAIREVERIKAHSSQFHLLINIDICPENAVAVMAIEALKKGVAK